MFKDSACCCGWERVLGYLLPPFAQEHWGPWAWASVTRWQASGQVKGEENRLGKCLFSKEPQSTKEKLLGQRMGTPRWQNQYNIPTRENPTCIWKGTSVHQHVTLPFQEQYHTTRTCDGRWVKLHPRCVCISGGSYEAKPSASFEAITFLKEFIEVQKCCWADIHTREQMLIKYF